MLFVEDGFNKLFTMVESSNSSILLNSQCPFLIGSREVLIIVLRKGID